jgi:O-methyltransferase
VSASQSLAKRLVRRSAFLNRLRKQIRFIQSIPAADYPSGKARAALRVRPFTLLSYERLAALWDAARAAPSGAFVECGVWSGGASGMMLLADPRREAWLFDSWEGLPEPGPQDVAVQGHVREKGWNFAEQSRVEHLLFEKLRMHRERIHLIPGWFDDTLPTTRPTIGPIAVLHLDADWYESTKVCLEQLYDLVVPGGVVAVDDYFHWRGCAQAVDEFLGESIEMRRVGDAAHWRK